LVTGNMGNPAFSLLLQSIINEIFRGLTAGLSISSFRSV
jgi:hypothetical protein